MSQGSGRIEVVEQLRGLAALSVTWFHLTNQYSDWVMSSGTYGWLGVEAFFVISGFVIPLSLAGDWWRFGARAVPGFFLRRLIRIEPPYLLSVLLVVLLNVSAAQFSAFQGQSQSISVEQILWHAAYLIPLTQYEWLQPVYWGGACVPLLPPAVRCWPRLAPHSRNPRRRAHEERTRL